MSRTHNAWNEDPSALPPGPKDENEPAAAEASFQTAFEQAGGAAMLAGWAQADPARFFALLARRLPAPAPAESRVIFCPVERPIAFEKADPSAEPIWMIGPSRPTDAPEPIESAEARDLMTATTPRMSPRR